MQSSGKQHACRVAGNVPGEDKERKMRKVGSLWAESHCCLVGCGSLDYILNDKEDQWIVQSRKMAI